MSGTPRSSRSDQRGTCGQDSCRSIARSLPGMWRGQTCRRRLQMRAGVVGWTTVDTVRAACEPQSIGNPRKTGAPSPRQTELANKKGHYSYGEGHNCGGGEGSFLFLVADAQQPQNGQQYRPTAASMQWRRQPAVLLDHLIVASQQAAAMISFSPIDLDCVCCLRMRQGGEEIAFGRLSLSQSSLSLSQSKSRSAR